MASLQLRPTLLLFGIWIKQCAESWNLIGKFVDDRKKVTSSKRPDCSGEIATCGWAPLEISGTKDRTALIIGMAHTIHDVVHQSMSRPQPSLTLAGNRLLTRIIMPENVV